MGGKCITLIVMASMFAGCFSLNPVYVDDWAGSYTLREYNACCDTATAVKLKLEKQTPDNYNWKVFFTSNNSDTIYGEAVYEKKRLKFFVSDTAIANKYFTKKTNEHLPVFWMIYDDLSSKKDSFVRADHFTRWDNDLKDYPRSKMLFAGVDYHFIRNDNKIIVLEKNKKK